MSFIQKMMKDSETGSFDTPAKKDKVDLVDKLKRAGVPKSLIEESEPKASRQREFQQIN